MNVTPDGKGGATAELKIGEVHRNPYGMVHGGVYASIADNVMGGAVAGALGNGKKFNTTDLHVRYLRSMTDGTISATASVVKLGRRLTQAECSLRGDDGKLVATATASFFVIDE